jgi:chromosome segregation ATPase
MSDTEDRSSTLPESPGDDEFLITEDAEISEEDRNEILAQIETVVEKNQIPVTDELFKLHPKRKGALFPILLNIVTFLLVAGGVLFMFRFFQARQELLSVETRAYLSTEGKLIEELKKESEEAIAAKEQEISKIQNELAELDRQSRDLQQNMEESIRAREEELREELEAELAAERERLQGEGISQQEIEAQLEALEARRREEFNRQIAEYRDEAQAELAQKEAELTEAREMAERVLEQANEERARLAEETRQREAELRRQFEEEREALESRSSEAETKLRELAEVREREILINDQIIGSYAEIIDDIQAGNVEAAGNSLDELKRFIQDPAVQTLPSIANRKNVELFIINNIQDTLETKAGSGGAETKSLLEAANLVVTARALAERADEAAEAGAEGEAKRLYTQALAAVPVLNRAFRSIRNIEENQTAGAIRGIVDEARRILEEGDREEALRLFRQAALMSAGVNEQLAADAVTGLERVHILNNRDDVREREETIDVQEQAITRLEAAVDELENTVTEQAEAIALRENIVARRDETIEEQQRRIAEYEREGENLQARIEEQAETIALNEEELAAENTELRGLTDTIAEKEGEIAELRKQLASLPERSAAEQSEISSADADRLALEAKETAYQEILDFVGYLLGDKPSRFKREIEEKADADIMYRNIIESIQELAESTVAPEELVATAEMKLIGTIASVTAGRVVIEALEAIPVPEGARILIKRRTSSGEVPIADGEVYDVTAGRVSAKITDRISATRSPMVMDLVYMEVER